MTRNILYMVLCLIFGAIAGHFTGRLNLSLKDVLLLALPVGAFMSMLADYIIYK